MMEKKKILVVQGTLNAGGAEKATVSFLNTLPRDKYEVDLMLSSRKGLFYSQVPEWVNIIDAPYPFSCLSHKPTDWRFYVRHNPLMWARKVKRTFCAKRQHKLHVIQSLWKQWCDDIPAWGREYDAAYGGQEGMCNYYIMDKVKAKRKILWIHCDYEWLKYADDFDRPYFSQATCVATMSPASRDILKRHFPESSEQFLFLENISNGAMIRKMASLPINEGLFCTDGINIVTVGRLAPPKNYHRAIRTAAELKKRDVKFRWVVVGEGPLRPELEALVQELGVQDNFRMIGLRSNPYQYMAKADMLVVTSDFEGRSIAIDEAQILGIPVITTNYPTAHDAVIDKETGLICEMKPESLADAIELLSTDQDLQADIRRHLECKKDGNVAEIEKYMKVLDGE